MGSIRFRLTAAPGQEPPLGFLLQTGRSTWADLQTGHSLGVNDFRDLNFGYAAFVVE
jgi:hypothetical protein